MCWQGGARRMLKQLKGKSSDETLDDIDADDEFSDLGVLDDSNSMYMVGNVPLRVTTSSWYLSAWTAACSMREQQACTVSQQQPGRAQRLPVIGISYH